MAASLVRLALAGLIMFSSVDTIAGPPADQEVDSRALEQLETAKQAKRKAHKKSGEEKRRILDECVLEYQKVLDQFGEEKRACAEAAFRIGEIERSLGNAKSARSAFESTLRYGQDSPLFAARALNELAHLSRRAADPDGAVAAYERVLQEYGGQEGEAVKALTWIGKVEKQRGNVEKARAAWLSIADRYPSMPVQAIRAADLAALCALEAGDTDTARQIVNQTSNRFSADNKDQAWWSPDVEKALEKMKAPRRLTPTEPADGG